MGGENHLITASKAIKDLIKKVKEMDQEAVSGAAKHEDKNE
jgi:hypothetical protein